MLQRRDKIMQQILTICAEDIIRKKFSTPMLERLLLMKRTGLITMLYRDQITPVAVTAESHMTDKERQHKLYFESRKKRWTLPELVKHYTVHLFHQI